MLLKTKEAMLCKSIEIVYLQADGDVLYKITFGPVFDRELSRGIDEITILETETDYQIGREYAITVDSNPDI